MIKIISLQGKCLLLPAFSALVSAAGAVVAGIAQRRAVISSLTGAAVNLYVDS